MLQEVFLQVWMQADRYDEARSTPRGWILMLARSRALDRLRRRDSVAPPRGGRRRGGGRSDPAGRHGASGERSSASARSTSALGRAVAGPAALHRARLLRGAHPHADRRAAGGAAGHGQIPDPAGHEQAPAGVERQRHEHTHTPTASRSSSPPTRWRAGRRRAARARGAPGRRLRGVPPPARPLAGGSREARGRGAAGRAVGDHAGPRPAAGGRSPGPAAPRRRSPPARRAPRAPWLAGRRPPSVLLAFALWGARRPGADGARGRRLAAERDEPGAPGGER